MSYVCKFIGNNRTFAVSGGHEGDAGVRTAMNFNPSGDSQIDRIKGFLTAAAQEVLNQRDNHLALVGKAGQRINEIQHTAAMRSFDTALRHLEITSMFAVKAAVASKKSIGKPEC